MKLFKSKNREQYSEVMPLQGQPCLSGDDVINNSAKDLVTKIHSLVSVTDTIWQELYLATLYRFAEFCQAMPNEENGEPYTLLKQQLNLIIAALILRRGLLLPKNSEAEKIAEQESRWTFAVFSAALIYQIHRIQTDRRIILYNKQGDLDSLWHPLSGSLCFPNHFYRVIWNLSSTAIPAVEFNTALIARLLPTKVIHWLSQDVTLLTVWWQSISEREDENNPILKIILHAAQELNWKSPEAPTNENNKSNDPIAALLNYVEAYPQDSLAWVQVEQGLLISKAVLQKFLSESKTHQNINDFIENNKHLLSNKNQSYLLTYRPQAYEDRRIIEGIIIKSEFLNNFWQQKVIDIGFKPAIL